MYRLVITIIRGSSIARLMQKAANGQVVAFENQSDALKAGLDFLELCKDNIEPSCDSTFGTIMVVKEDSPNVFAYGTIHRLGGIALTPHA